MEPIVLTVLELKKLGFETNHEDQVLNKYYKHGTVDGCEYRVSVEKNYLPLSNAIGLDVYAWRCNENGAIVKRVSVSDVKTMEDFYTILKLTGITL